MCFPTLLTRSMAITEPYLFFRPRKCRSAIRGCRKDDESFTQRVKGYIYHQIWDFNENAQCDLLLHLVSQFQILVYISSQQFAPRGMALTHVSANIDMEKQRTSDNYRPGKSRVCVSSLNANPGGNDFMCFISMLSYFFGYVNFILHGGCQDCHYVQCYIVTPIEDTGQIWLEQGFGRSRCRQPYPLQVESLSNQQKIFKGSSCTINHFQQGHCKCLDKKQRKTRNNK